MHMRIQDIVNPKVKVLLQQLYSLNQLAVFMLHVGSFDEKTLLIILSIVSHL